MPAVLFTLVLAATPAPPPAGAPVTLPAAGPVRAAADAIRAQGGVPVRLAGVAPDAPVTLPPGPLPAWAAVDALAAAAGARVELKDGGRAAELAPGTPAPAAADGAFRVAVREVACRADFTTGRSVTEVTLTLNWEERIPVYRADGEPEITAVALDTGPRPPPAPARAQAPARDCVATAVVRLAGVPRAATRIAVLEGVFTVTAAPALLTVTVPDLGAPAPVTVGGVTVTVGKPVRVGTRYDVVVDLAYPPPAVEFESFEAGLWLTRNRLTLTGPTGQAFTPVNSDDADAGGRARLTYRFPAGAADAPALDAPAGWSAAVRTPAPLAEYAVRFRLKDIPLP